MEENVEIVFLVFHSLDKLHFHISRFKSIRIFLYT